MSNDSEKLRLWRGLRILLDLIYYSGGAAQQAKRELKKIEVLLGLSASQAIEPISAVVAGAVEHYQPKEYRTAAQAAKLREYETNDEAFYSRF